MKSIVYVGLDVHKDSIAVGVAHEGAAGAVESLGTIPNRAEPISRLMRKLSVRHRLRVCYEAGPCGTRSTGSCARWA
jgi:hypothetical protein